jgi:nucleoside-diphosphate-sugar epimerase
MQTTLATADVAAAVARVGRSWESLRGARLFVSGGTGFVGTWLLATLCAANRLLGLDARVLVLTRDPAAFARSAPDLADDEAVDLLTGDVRDFSYPAGRFTHVIHGAASAHAALAQERPSDVRSTIIEGARRMVGFCKATGVGRMLALSSGAVYRQAPVGGRSLSEDDPLGWDTPDSDQWVYHHAKRQMESMLAAGGADDAPAVSVARLFSFVGPGLPLDRHFAIGNFIADALSGGPVVVHGDGTPVRSYLYAADMAAWLWTILIDGRAARAYNVGAERAVTIAEVARIVAETAAPPLDVRIEGAAVSSGGGSWYVPDTRRARGELSVAEWTALEEAVHRTIAWHREGAR